MTIKIPSIQTASLNMRSFNNRDARSLHQVLSDRETLRYFPNVEPPSLEAVHNLIKAQLSHWEEHGYGWWAIEPRWTSRLIGWGGLRWLPDTSETEVAYLLAKDYWGQGLATEIAIASLDYAFNNLGLDRIVGIVHPENIASRRVLEKSGMSYTGRYTYFGMECYRFIKHNNSLNTR